MAKFALGDLIEDPIGHRNVVGNVMEAGNGFPDSYKLVAHAVHLGTRRIWALKAAVRAVTANLDSDVACEVNAEIQSMLLEVEKADA